MPLILEPLSALPVYGEPAVGFSLTGAGLHAQGFVVQFKCEQASWVGNFARGLSKFDLAIPHPDGQHAIVIAGGHAYIINPVTKTLAHHFGGAIVEVLPYTRRGWLIINNQNISFMALGTSGEIWRSRRISWDGMRSIELKDNLITGESWDVSDKWIPFTLNLEDGTVTGGAYPPELE